MHGGRDTKSLPDGAPLAALVLGNVALAFGPVFVRHADVGPVAAGFWRIALAIPFLLLLCPLARQPIPRIAPRLLGFVALGGLCFAADLASWHIGILQTTLANATLFGNSATLFFPIYGFLIARAWPSRTQGTALLMALIGAGLLMGRSASLSHAQLIGDLLCLLAGVLYTGYFVVMARARGTLQPLPVLAISTIASAPPLLLLFALVLGERIIPADWTPLIGLALASQVLGQGLMTYALGRLSPLVVGIGLLIQPIVAALAGWGWYAEIPGPLDFVGAGLVAVALVLVRRAPRERLAPQVATVE
ncbi:MAG: DMT family transporter [Pseudomonadota bacterium]